MKIIKSVLIILLLLTGKNNLAQNGKQTLLGLHGTNSPSFINALNAQCARFGFSDHKLKNAFNNNGTEFFTKIKQLHSNGIEIINFLIWPEDTVNHVGVDFERIPVGEDKDTVFHYMRKFLTEMGPYIDWIQISQEPLGVTRYDETKYSISEILDWWRSIAMFIRSEQNQYPQISHIKIVTAGITGLTELAAGGGTPELAVMVDSIITFGEEYCDAIDMHLHTHSLEDAEKKINFMKSKTDKPLTCTEWSQSHAAKETGWFGQINSTYGITNKKVIDSAYVNPMSPEDWNSFISTAPFTINFIPDFYKMLNRNCFIHACYGSAVQYGSPAFDWCQLFATKTTDPVSANEPFNSDYINLAGDIENGIIEDSCNVTSVDKIENTKASSGIYFYPNPAGKYLYVNTSNHSFEKPVIIFDILGREVLRTKHSNNKINISKLSSGTYFLRVELADKIIHKKIMIK